MMAHTRPYLEQVVSLTAELHVPVLNAVMDHLDVVAGALITDPVTACIAVNLGCNRLEDRLDVLPVEQCVSTVND